ncbi:sulfatase [Fluviibacterium sp. DFM31]|uniref:Sulfatase n=1 Tax=Meridianimarinicoccus marinus TaxID=3231483 RepID=A0ABV3LAQ4_9RHOB
MRAIFVLFDTLNRHYLEPYGGTEMETPNFRRLADRSVRFDNHYVGSLPCMPARRDLQTGRLNFLHRSWGPLEPFDVAMTEVLKQAGIYSHMITDHYHYLEVGGAGYLNAFSSFEAVRGQEGDRWKADLVPPLEDWRAAYHPAQFSDRPGDMRYHNMVNRSQRLSEADFSSVQCFDLGCDFLDRNQAADDWFLQIETFDPHEPFDAPERLKEEFAAGGNGPVRDWPPYAKVTEGAAEADEMRANYKALLAHCDEQLGRLLDKMDALEMWDDTMLIVSTDHGFLTGEHGWWAKNKMPAYQEIAHIPLFIHHPAHAHRGGTAHGGLFQTPDLMPTILDAFGCEMPAAVRGRSLLPALADPGDPGHEAVIFGYFGGAVNVTDGCHAYFRYPEDMLGQCLYQYTLMPSHMLVPFGQEELGAATLTDDLDFAAGFPVLKVPVPPSSAWFQSHGPAVMEPSKSLLYNIEADPAQQTPVQDAAITDRMTALLCTEMTRQNAPPEAFGRLGLNIQKEA